MVMQADTAQEGIDLARRTSPALILMDIGLQDMDGYEATTILKNDAATKHIPVLAVTAYAMWKTKNGRGRRAATGSWPSRSIWRSSWSLCMRSSRNTVGQPHDRQSHNRSGMYNTRRARL